MQVPSPTPLIGQAIALTPATLDCLTANQLALLLLTSPAQRLVIDCGRLYVPHPLGVSHFISQMLEMRHQGIDIWLCNVHPVLERCLQRLALGTLFHLTV